MSLPYLQFYLGLSNGLNTIHAAGGGAGYTYGVYSNGGYVPGGDYQVNTIDYITIASTGNATDFGDSTVYCFARGAVSDGSRGCYGGGGRTGISPNNGPPYLFNVIDYVTIATPSNATDFGDLSSARESMSGGVDDATRGVFAGGYISPTRYNILEYITIATTGNVTDFGDLSMGMASNNGVNDDSRGVWAWGYSSGFTNVMEYITIATTGNSTDFGDLSVARDTAEGNVYSSTRGVFAGGYNSSYTHQNVMDYITIQTTGNATDFGDLAAANASPSGSTSLTRGCYGGGSESGTRTNRIQYITIDTTGNTTDFGDLTQARSACSAASGG